MSKRICPSCGSRNTAKILWGEPAKSFEMAEKLKKQEIVLGGCFIPVPHPTHHCHTCEKDFGGSYFAEPTFIKELSFYVGGYFGPSHRVNCNTKESGKSLDYEYYPDSEGFMVRAEELVNHVSLEDRWKEFNADFLRCYIIDWRETYVMEACDGTQWELTVTFDNGTTFHRHGSNDFPPHWNKLLRLFLNMGYGE